MIGILLFATAVFINIVCHEAGHMIVAKCFKMEVPVFSIGIGPSLFEFKTKATKYCLKAIPLGGFCEIKGMGGEGVPSKWYHLPVILAGIIANIGILFLSLLCLYYNVLHNPTPITITDTTPIAIEAGFKTGDTILSVNSETDVASVIDSDIDELTFKVKHSDGEVEEIYFDRSKTTDRKVGITLSMTYFAEGGTAFKSAISGMQTLFSKVPECIKTLGTSISNIYTFNKEFKEGDGITLVSATSFVGHNYNTMGDNAMQIFFSLCATMGFSLAIFNLLPIPCLDGGRALIILLDLLTFRKIKAEVFNKAITISYIFILLFSVVTMIVEYLRLTF